MREDTVLPSEDTLSITVQESKEQMHERRNGLSELGARNDDSPEYGHGPAYWNQCYAHDADEYDWLLEWKEIASIVEAFVSKETRVLQPGCGNSKLAAEMYDAGYKRQLNLDNASVVIEQMKERHAGPRPEIEWATMDATKLSELETSSFGAIIETALMDTLQCCSGAAAVCTAFLDEMHRVLAPGGVFITISLNQYSTKQLNQWWLSSRYKWEAGRALLSTPWDEDAEEWDGWTVIVCAKAPVKAKRNPFSCGRQAAKSSGIQRQLESWESEACRQRRLQIENQH